MGHLSGEPWDGNGKDKNEQGVALCSRPKTRHPPLYRVLMLNDDYTPMEFVVGILEVYFMKSHEEAKSIMLQVHTNGMGVCGLYTREVAEAKAHQVMDVARANQHPLRCTIEPEPEA